MRQCCLSWMVGWVVWGLRGYTAGPRALAVYFNASYSSNFFISADRSVVISVFEEWNGNTLQDGVGLLLGAPKPNFLWGYKTKRVWIHLYKYFYNVMNNPSKRFLRTIIGAHYLVPGRDYLTVIVVWIAHLSFKNFAN